MASVFDIFKRKKKENKAEQGFTFEIQGKGSIEEWFAKAEMPIDGFKNLETLMETELNNAVKQGITKQPDTDDYLDYKKIKNEVQKFLTDFFNGNQKATLGYEDNYKAFKEEFGHKFPHSLKPGDISLEINQDLKSIGLRFTGFEKGTVKKPTLSPNEPQSPTSKEFGEERLKEASKKVEGMRKLMKDSFMDLVSKKSDELIIDIDPEDFKRSTFNKTFDDLAGRYSEKRSAGPVSISGVMKEEFEVDLIKELIKYTKIGAKKQNKLIEYSQNTGFQLKETNDRNINTIKESQIYHESSGKMVTENNSRSHVNPFNDPGKSGFAK